jgi:putative phosphoesterase
MKIGIVSDTHSRHETVRKVLRRLEQHGAELVLHCGDIEDAGTVRLFRGLDVHYVFGNCDSDRDELAAAMAECGATLHGQFGHLEVAGRDLGWTHGDDKRLMLELEHSEAFDYVFYGHTHQREQHQTGKTLVVNPGALHRARPKSFVVLDVATGELQSVIVDEAMRE